MLVGMTELETVLGEAARATVRSVQQHLRDAMAARDRGDSAAMMMAVGAAMSELARLGESLEPGEGQMMQAIAQRFQGAMMRGDLTEAKQDMNVMFEKSGAKFLKKS